jgi:hypothetical protein
MFSQKKEQKKGKKRSADEAKEGEQKEGEEKKEGKEGKEEKNAKKQKTEAAFTPGVLVDVKGLGEGVTRQQIKDAFGAFGKVAFVDIPKDGTEGVIRFDKAGLIWMMCLCANVCCRGCTEGSEGVDRIKERIWRKSSHHHSY